MTPEGSSDRWRYFWHGESECLMHTQNPHMATRIFMEGAQELDFMEWVDRAMKSGSELIL